VAAGGADDIAALVFDIVEARLQLVALLSLLLFRRLARGGRGQPA
jgi:hypothetical protein